MYLHLVVSVSVTNSSFLDSTAGQDAGGYRHGGALYLREVISAHFISCSFSGNKASVRLFAVMPPVQYVAIQDLFKACDVALLLHVPWREWL